MTQCMETWIVADVDALKRYYQQGFLEGALSPARDLEAVDRGDVARALARATRGTQKGVYHKIDHAKVLLTRIDPLKVSERCGHCRRLFDVVMARLQTVER